jgi:hypothetical protein
MIDHIRKTALSILAILSFIICSGQKGNDKVIMYEGVPYEVDWSAFLKNPGRITALSSIATGISYISLKTPPGEPLGQISRVIFMKDNILIADATKAIFVFDRIGNFIRKISHVGRGPGEYMFIDGLTIDGLNNQIVVGGITKLIFYDMQGNFVKDVPVAGERFGETVWIGKDLYVLKLNNIKREGDTSAMSTIVVNSMGDLVTRHRYYVKEKTTFILPPSGRLVKYGDGILVTEPFNDTIYMVTGNGNRIPYIINNYGTYRASREYAEGASTAKDTKYILQPQTAIFPGYAYVSFWYKGSRNFGLWDLKNRKAMIFPTTELNIGVKDDIDNGPPFLNPRDFSSGIFIDIIEPVNLLKDNSIVARKGSALETLMKNMKIDDNPVIRIINMKPKI